MAIPEVGLPDRRRAADHDAALLGGGDIDGCIAQPCRDEQLQVRQFLDDGAREGGALAHRAHDVEALQRLDHVLVAAEVLVEDLDVEIARNLRPVRYLEYDILVVVEDRAALARHSECPWLARGWGGRTEPPYSTRQFTASVLSAGASKGGEVDTRYGVT